MSTVTMSSTSRQYLRLPVSATWQGVAQDPTADTVEFAAVTVGSEPSSWTAGSWETDTSTDPDTFWARILVSGTGGGGTLALADGTYDLWVRVTDSPERPVQRICTLIVA